MKRARDVLWAPILILSLTSGAAAQTSPCLICRPKILLEPAVFGRNLEADAGDLDFLARIHVMAATGLRGLGISMATQWVVPHGNEPAIMLHATYTVLKRPLGVRPFLGVMNTTLRRERVWKPMTALYVTVPSKLPGVRIYTLGTLLLADDVIPSLAVGLSLPFGPVLPKPRRAARNSPLVTGSYGVPTGNRHRCGRTELRQEEFLQAMRTLRESRGGVP
ncbi:MAG: hypothetical protein ACE5HP_07690 [Gemmatimonadota bacterium]